MRNLSRVGQGIVVLWIGVAPIAVTIDYLYGLPGVDLWYGMSVAGGIFALFGMTGTLALATRVASLQRHIPHDSGILLHRMLGTVALVSSVVHGASKGVAGTLPNASSIGIMITATIGAILVIRWIRTRESKRRWSYDRHKRMHLILFSVMSALLVFHLIEASFGDGLSFLGLAIVSMSMALPPWMAIVSRIRSTRAEVVSAETTGSLAVVTLRPLSTYRYRGGQYAYVTIDGVSHPFSFLSSPRDDFLRFAIRIGGPFTRRFASVEPKETVRVSAPLGRFGWTAGRPSDHESALMVGTGTGAAPVLSVARDQEWQASHPGGKTVVALKNADEIELIRELADLKSSCGDQLAVIDRKAERRRIDAPLLRDATSDCARWRFFICASSGVAAQLIEEITALGSRTAGIHQESFSLSEVKR